MKKLSLIAITVMQLFLLTALALAGTGLDVATPRADVQAQGEQVDQTASSPAAPANASLSRRNKARLDVQEEKKLRQEKIKAEKAREAAGKSGQE